MQFPVYLHLGPWHIHPHLFFEFLAYSVGFWLYLRLRRRYGDPVPAHVRWSAVTAAVVGGALGSKLLFLLEDPALTASQLRNPEFLLGGKTIVGALIGGLIAVELTKRYLGERRSTGDVFAVPLALGTAIGRVGCFLTGLSDFTYGTPTSLPWGVDFGDGIHRHPTQLYESLFLLLLLPFLYSLMTKARRGEFRGPTRWRSGDAFRLFMVAYMGFRLVCDAFKPYTHVALGLCSIQWAALFTLLYYARDIRRWLTAGPSTTAVTAGAK